MGAALAGCFYPVLIVMVLVSILWLTARSPSQVSTAIKTGPIGWVYRPVSSWLMKRWKEPGGHVRVLTWVGVFGFWGLAYVLNIVVAEKYVPDLRAEAVSIALAVIVIDELARYRNRVAYKRSIIRQMASRSNDFALDATRIAVEEDWHSNGSLKGVSLWHANLENANLEDANLNDTYLVDVNLKGAELVYANLENTCLSGAILEDANLTQANLSGTDLKEVNLKWAVLAYTNLQGADLRGANLEGANLTGANLEGADMQDTSVDIFTIYDDTTNGPYGTLFLK